MLIDLTVEEFLLETASDSPAPGGGSVSALAGSLGAALSSMVANLTLSKELEEPLKKDMEKCNIKSIELMNYLKDAVDKDTEAFNVVMAAFKMPKATDEDKKARSAAIQSAMKNAADLPFVTSKLCVEVMKLSITLLKDGNKNAASDAAVAGLIAFAGFKGAAYNVKINLSSIKDPIYLSSMKEKLEILTSEAEKLYKEVLEKAEKAI